MDEVIPTWLKVMENGSLGEARTKAFLADRFWVMERSVDVDGADFLIHRRTVSERFTDKLPPRVGVIQSKFFQDRGTTHYIHKSYVLDDAGQPIEGFFALLHVGREDKGEIYLLSARDISTHLKISSAHKAEKYTVGASALVPQFKVGSRSHALDRIEHSLKSLSLSQARMVLDRLHIPYRRFADDDIDFDWSLPLPNPVADLPRLFREQKEKLRSVLFEIEEVLETFDRIFVERNPETALKLLQDVCQHVDGHGHLSFGDWGDFNWQDLEDAMSVHERWRQSLVQDGLLDAYVLMGSRLRETIVETVGPIALDQVGDFVEVELSFDPVTFGVRTIEVVTGAEGGRRADVAGKDRVLMGRSIRDFPPIPKTKPEALIKDVWIFVMRAVIESRYPDPYAEDAD